MNSEFLDLSSLSNHDQIKSSAEENEHRSFCKIAQMVHYL